MDTRRLRCLLLRRGLTAAHDHDARVAEVTVHDRDTRVAELETELRGHVETETTLALFVARDRASGAFLSIQSKDAQRLAFGPPVDQDRDEPFLATRMNRDAAVHDHFPVQPPLCDGTDSLVHVIACCPRTQKPPRQGTTGARGIDQGSAMTGLIASARLTQCDEVRLKGGATAATSTTVSDPPPLPTLVMRCKSPRAILWLDDSDHPASKTTLIVPPAWRTLSVTVFRWLQLGVATHKRGRRAVIVGAPRAGKSAFLGFLLVQLLWLQPPRPVCIVDVPGVAFARIARDRKVDEGTRGEHFGAELRDPQTLYVFDVAPSRGVGPLRASEVRARTIIVAPHLPAAPRPATDGATPRTKVFVLPRWTLDEVRLGRQLCGPPSSGFRGLSMLFAKWGGLPGRLCTEEIAVGEAALERALARLTPKSVVVALATLQRTGSWHEIAMGRDSARWRPLVVAHANDEGWTFTGQVAFTSQYVCDRVLGTVPLRTWTIRSHATPHMAILWTQLRTSLLYLAQEEEEKHEEPPASARTRRGGSHRMRPGEMRRGA